MHSILICLLGLVLTAAVIADDYSRFQLAAPPPIPADNILNPARVTLGKMLFFDQRLSGDNRMSCASCHKPSNSWTDNLPRATGNNNKTLRRATPTLINIAYSKTLNWDGTAKTLEQQALIPLTSPDEMNQDLADLADELSAIATYVTLFENAYPARGISGDTIAKALASFERSIISTDSPFDIWLQGDATALSTAQQRGFQLFIGKARCEICHNGFNFTDNGFHNIGLPQDTAVNDPGRIAIINTAANYNAFKTPTLRNIAQTAPYMHNGVYQTLTQVIEHYDRGGVVKDGLSPNILPLDLSARDKSDLAAFLVSLTGKPTSIIATSSMPGAQ